MEYRKRVIELRFNWYATPENGEECTVVKLLGNFNSKQVVEIKEHLPMGDGDRLYYDLVYHSTSTDKQTSTRIFNPNLVEYDTAPF